MTDENEITQHQNDTELIAALREALDSLEKNPHWLFRQAINHVRPDWPQPALITYTRAALREIDRLTAERHEFWGQTHMKEGTIQRLKKNMSEIVRELKPPTPDIELTPEDTVRLAKYLRSISESAARTLKLLDDHGVWTGFDDDVHDRVLQVLQERDHWKKQAQEPRS